MMIVIYKYLSCFDFY